MMFNNLWRDDTEMVTLFASLQGGRDISIRIKLAFSMEFNDHLCVCLFAYIAISYKILVFGEMYNPVVVIINQPIYSPPLPNRK